MTNFRLAIPAKQQIKDWLQDNQQATFTEIKMAMMSLGMKEGTVKGTFNAMRNTGELRKTEGEGETYWSALSLSHFKGHVTYPPWLEPFSK